MAENLANSRVGMRARVFFNKEKLRHSYDRQQSQKLFTDFVASLSIEMSGSVLTMINQVVAELNETIEKFPDGYEFSYASIFNNLQAILEIVYFIDNSITYTAALNLLIIKLQNSQANSQPKNN